MPKNLSQNSYQNRVNKLIEKLEYYKTDKRFEKIIDNCLYEIAACENQILYFNRITTY